MSEYEHRERDTKLMNDSRREYLSQAEKTLGVPPHQSPLWSMYKALRQHHKFWGNFKFLYEGATFEISHPDSHKECPKTCWVALHEPGTTLSLVCNCRDITKIKEACDLLIVDLVHRT